MARKYSQAAHRQSSQRHSDNRPRRQPADVPDLGLDVGIRHRQRRNFPLFLDRKFRLQLDGVRQSVPLQHDVDRHNSYSRERGSALEQPCSGRRFHAVLVTKHISVGSRGRGSWVRRGHAFLDRQRDLSLSRRCGGQRWKGVLAQSGQLGATHEYVATDKHAPPLDTQQIDACWCGPSFFEGSDGVGRVVTSHGSTLRTWQVQMSPSPTLAPEATATINSGQDPGFFTSVSSNGTAAGSAIIWAVGRPTGAGADPTAVNLFAFAATPSSGSTTLTQLFSAPAGSWPNTGGNANIVPVVANGKVFVASAYLDGSGNTRGQLNIFGTGGTGAPISSACAVARPASGHMISGTLIAVNGETLTLQTRTGKPATIDASRALQNERVTGPLKLGTPYTAQGMTFDASGALVATAIARAKPSSGLWPPDR